MNLRRFLLVVTAALIVVLALVVWFLPPSDDFRADNPFWNGLEDMSFNYLAEPIYSLSDLPVIAEGSTLILIPYLDFTPAELEELHRFATQGGTLVLADDYGYGNQVLEYLGLEVRFSGQALLDPFSNYKSKWLPRISRFVPSPVTSDIESLVLNHATCLIDIENDDALALSSVFSFLDLDDNESQDEGEPAGPLPVISQHSLGNGRVILISDPSIFINSMATIEDNYALIQNIAAISRSGLLIDQSHLLPSNFSQSKSLLASIRSYFSRPAGAVGLVVLALAVALLPVWRAGRGGAGGQILEKGDDVDYRAG